MAENQEKTSDEILEKIAAEDRKLEIMVKMPKTLEYDGKPYELKPLDITGMAKLKKWAKDFLIQETKENLGLLGNAVDDDFKKRTWESVAKMLSEVFTSPVMESPEAIAQWVFLSLQAGDPTMTKEKAALIVKDHNLRDLSVMLMTLNGVSEEDGPNPLQPRPVQKL